MTEAAEWAGVGLGIVYLLLAIRELRSCWIAGALASLLFGVVFWEAGLPMQALLQLYYIAVAVHGWMHWGSGTADTSPRPHRAPNTVHLVAIALVSIATVTTVALRQEQQSLQAWSDALTSWAGVAATWMVARKILEAWLYWIVIDMGTALLYFSSGLLASSGLYVVYAVLAAVAWKEWNTSFQNAKHT